MANQVTPLRRKFSITDKDGKSYPFSLELADFSFAQREIDIKLTPFGATEFWTQIDADPIYTNVVLIYVGLRRAGVKGLSLDWIIGQFPTEMLLNDVSPTLREAMEDFSQRIEGNRSTSDALPATEGTSAPSQDQTKQNSGPSLLSISA